MKKIKYLLIIPLLTIHFISNAQCQLGNQEGDNGSPEKEQKTSETTSQEVNRQEIEIQRPVDPNEIIGPLGYGQRRMVSKDMLMPYTILFENDPDLATASAQVVKITQPLSEFTDYSSIELGSFGFGDYVFTVPEGRNYYQERIDLTDSLNIYLNVTAGLDVVNKRLFWFLESLDPKTGQLPNDPEVGFLPVNDTLIHNGEGFVTYTIKPRNNAQSGDSIVAQASIVFDINEAIETNTVYNIVDAIAPESKILETLTHVNDTTYQINWQAQDDTNGSGVATIDIYMANDEGLFQVVEKDRDVNESYSFYFNPDKDYKFFTQATDNVGNQEPIKAFAENSILSESINHQPMLSKAFRDTSILKNTQSATILTNLDSYFIDEDNDILEFSVDKNVSGLDSLKFENNSIIIYPTIGNIASCVINITAVDPVGAKAKGSFLVNFEDINTNPLLGNPLSDTTAYLARSFVYQLPLKSAFINYDENDNLTYHAKTSNSNELPGWLKFNASNGLLTGVPGYNDIGQIQLEIVATDTAGYAVSNGFNLTVINTNHAPVAILEEMQAVDEFDRIQLDASKSYDTDYDDIYFHWNIAGKEIPNDSTQSSISFNVPEIFADTILPIIVKVNDWDSISTDTLFLQVLDQEILLASYSFTGNANDDSGNGHDGTVFNAKPCEDRNENPASAFKLSGNGEYIDLGTWFNVQDFTISFWAKPDSIQNDFAMLIDNNHSDYRSWSIQQIGSSQNQFQFGSQTSEVWSSFFELPDSSWTHIVCTHSVDSAKFYINGVMINSQSITKRITYDGTEHLFVGKWGGGERFYNGAIDDINIYNYDLSPEEVQVLFLMQNSKPIADAGNDLIVNEGDTVNLDASLSYDPDGDVLSFYWISSEDIILDSVNSKTPSFIAPQVNEDKSFRFILSVNDGTYNSNNDTVQVTVLDVPPIVYIPDSAFKACLVNDSLINLNGDAEIQVSEAEIYLGDIYVSNKGIENVIGVEAFINLNRFNCDSNLISEINVKNNIKLISLNCSNNNIDTLKIETNSELEILSCHNNNLSGINVSGSIKLKTLFCFMNQIKELDLSNNSNLSQLNCSSNKLVSLNLKNGNNQNLALEWLDATNNQELACVTVDDVEYSQTNWIEYFDEGIIFSLGCSNLSSDATLFDLLLSGTTVDGFNSDTLNYGIELPQSTTTIPEITAVANDEKATVTIIQATTLPGTAEISVIAEDGTALTYTVTLNLATSIDDKVFSEVKVYPNPIKENLELYIPTLYSLEQISLYDNSGRSIFIKLIDTESTNYHFNTANLVQGVYFLDIKLSNGQNKIFKLIKE